MVLGEKPSDDREGLWSRLINSAWATSAYEVLFTIVLSNLAIFLAIFIQALTNNEDRSFSDLLNTVSQEKIKPTELIAFVLALIAPAMWIMFRHIRLWRHSYLLLAFLGVHAIIVLSTSIIFSLALSSTLKNMELALFWAKFCLIISLFVWYATLVYHKKIIESPEKNLPTPTPDNESGSDVLKQLRAG